MNFERIAYACLDLQSLRRMNRVPMHRVFRVRKLNVCNTAISPLRASRP
jgi:hypothetical protein